MLTSFVVERFRLFSKLEIRGLSRVNLFVGKNNAGKSALLEAVEVYSHNAAKATLIQLVEEREETWSRRGRTGLIHYEAEGIRHLFMGRQLPPVDGEGFLLGPVADPSKQLRVTVAAYQLQTDAFGLKQRRRIPGGALDLDGAEVETWLVAAKAGDERRLLPFGQTANTIQKMQEPALALQRVPTRTMSRKRVAALWDAITLTPLEDDVVAGLKTIEPTIEGIGFVENSQDAENEARIPIARLAGQAETLPLRSMGDGISRLFHITLALVNSKKGVLLVDEFENGLHWGVQRQVWKTIFRLAEALDVQVFATTHSRDCVKAFQEAWGEKPQSGAFFRLENDGDGNVTAQPYSLERLTDAQDVDADVR